MIRTAFVTGGASGIGAATCRLFVENGYHVYIGDIQENAGIALAKELKNADFINVNVRREEELAEAFTIIKKKSEHLDVMVNNAAIVGVMGPIMTLSAEQYDLSQEIIQRSVFLGTKHAAKMMVEKSSGSIINVASIAGIMAGWSPHTYAACKAAVIQFTKSVAIELAEENIRVNAVCPGAIATPIHTGTTSEVWKERIKAVKKASADEQPIPRMGEPEEIAEAILWLASEKSSYVTGHALAVDGGATSGKIWRHQPDFLRQTHPARS
jgi:NAD(P)-dependent dehydrogenase (short-subunit alcohol dehydrogenase family)|tara:strand:- start:665 stop:1468 length:804 start_codon:yes stop_codon:yes gene_type:complete